MLEPVARSRTSMSAGPHIAILGAGPIGLEAAAAAVEHGWPFTVYEAAPHVAANVRAWGHVQLFTPWDLNVSSRVRRMLAEAGQTVPEGEICPPGRELVQRVLDPLAALPSIAGNLRLGSRVAAVSREGLLKSDAIGDPEERRRHPFRLLIETGEGDEAVEHADVVLDCTGSYGNPNTLGDGGIPAPGERRLADFIHRTLPNLEAEAEAWAGRTVLLAGAGHSAQTAARDLAAFAERHPGTRVLWAVRSPAPRWGRVADDPLPERAKLADAADALADGASSAVELRRSAAVEAVAPAGNQVEVTLRDGSGGAEKLKVDRILSLTGYVGDPTLYRQLQIHECYATSGPMKLAAALLGDASGDCLQQTSRGADSLTSPEPDFFLLGVKSYGRNPTFLLRTGWQQVDEVYGLLAGQRSR